MRLWPVLLLMASCAGTGSGRTFGEDVEFLRTHVDTVVLSSPDGAAQVAVVPAYQGRVMTSTAGGDAGESYGWIHYDFIEQGELVPHINVFGGEERFWLGPEGGQFAIFFEPGAEFTLRDWQTPPVIDSEPFTVAAQRPESVVFGRSATLTNYSGTRFDIDIRREVKLIDRGGIDTLLGIRSGGAVAVGYETRNRVTNTGENWSRATGMLSIWLLGMYKHSPRTTVVIPFVEGDEDRLGPIVNDAYFGIVPRERLVVSDGVLFFAADGQYRSKIGLGPNRATDVCGSWDAQREVLTIVQYNQPGRERQDYVNSMWELQDEPYGGDVINSYNDGPPEPDAAPLGPFYELETSSPALELARGESVMHVQRTYHFEGPREDLDRIARTTLGVGLERIEGALVY